MKGKTVKGQLDAVETEYIMLPRNILEHYKHVTIWADVIFVSRVAILITVSWNIYYREVYGLPSIKIPVIEVTI